jgi:hypothetical protein
MDNKNTHWTSEQDLWLIENRHRGVNYLMNELGRTRKAIRTRFSTLLKEGKIDETIVMNKSKVEEIVGEKCRTSEELYNTRESILELMQSKIGIVDWALHIMNNYDVQQDDKELFFLLAFPEEN